MKNNIYKIVLILSIMFAFKNNLEAQVTLVSPSAYMKGQFIEVGVSSCGTFGTDASAPVPAGFHPIGASGSVANGIGFNSDPGMDGYTVGSPAYCGDYFIPGAPIEGWGVQFNGNTFINTTRCESTPGIPGSIVSNSGSLMAQQRVDWSGSVNGLQVDQTTYFPNDKLYFVNCITLTNTTLSTTMNNVYYVRNVDPDNDRSQPTATNTNFTTINSVISQAPSQSLVVAVGNLVGCYLGLGSLDANSRVMRGGFFLTSPLSDYYNGLTVHNQSIGTTTQDQAISIAYYWPMLAPGQSVTIRFAYVLDESDLTEALASTGVQIISDGVDISNTLVDTICNGDTTLITINSDPAITWNWSPPANLSTTTGNSVFAYPCTNTTYTVVGTGAACEDSIIRNIQICVKACVCDTCSTCNDTCYWKVNGNVITGNNNIFGTLSNDNVRIFTNNIQRGIITSTGLFGYNTAVPTDRIDVNGTARIRNLPNKSANDLLVFANSLGRLRSFAISGLANQYLAGNGTWQDLPNANAVNTCTVTNEIPKILSGNTLGCSQIIDDGTNVGVNTSTPTDKVDINGTARVRNLPANVVNDKIVMANANGQLHSLTTSGSSTQYLAGNGTWQNIPDGNTVNTCTTSNQLPKIATGNTMTCSQIYDNATNVGVSTNAPTDKIDVNGTARVRILPTRATTDRIVFANANGQLRSLSPGTATQFLAGNGTWTNFPAFGNVTNTCGTTNFVPKVSTGNNYICSQIYDNGINVGIGTVTPGAKLHVVSTTGGFINITNIAENNSTGFIGLGSHSICSNNSVSVGATGIAQGSSATTSKVGLWGNISANSCTGNNIALYGQVVNNLGTFCNTHFAGYFAGQTLMGGPALVISDSTLKTNVRDVTDAMRILNALKPRTYDFDSRVRSGFALSNNMQYGFISQEVERVLPSIVQEVQGPLSIDDRGNVTENRTTYKAMNYDALISVLVKAVQEQDTRINDLEAIIAACCASSATARQSGNSEVNIVDITISDKNTIVLNQNVPNPFAESTSISYYIPETFKQASIMFTNMNGQVIKTLAIKEMGKGQLNVFADDLTSGQYTYTLVVDGKTIESKKMIKQ